MVSPFDEVLKFAYVGCGCFIAFFFSFHHNSKMNVITISRDLIIFHHKRKTNYNSFECAQHVLRQITKIIIMQDINKKQSVISNSEARLAHGESYYGSCISIADSVVEIDERFLLPNKSQVEPCINVVIEETDDILPEPKETQFVIPPIEHLPALQKTSLASSQVEMPLDIIVIITSRKEIKQAKVTYISNPSKDKSIFQKSKSVYQKTNILIFIIRTNIEELLDLKIEYREEQAKMLLFSKKTHREHFLRSVMIHGEAGLHFSELTENNTNLLLQNYCILTAHDHLVANLRFFKKLQVVPQFYHIFRECFKPSLEGNSHIFHHYSPSNNINTSEFFIYFFFTLYRDCDCEKLLNKYDVPRKIALRKISVLLQYRFYRIFQHSRAYKEFLLYVYFYAALAQKVEEASLREIAQWNVLNQDDERVQAVLSSLQKNQSCFLYLLGKNSVNNRILTNPRVSLETYINYKLAFCEKMLGTISEQDMGELLSRFIDHITVKAQKEQKEQGQMPVDLTKYTAKVVSLFVRDNRLIDQLNAGELYSKLKAKAKYSQQMGVFLFTALKAYIFPLIPQLLLDNYECTIIPLIIKPEVAEENSILLHFFQEQRVDERQLLFLLRIWQEMNSEEYNINVIEFVLLKFVAFNPHFDMRLLERIIAAFAQQLKDTSVTEQCKSCIPAFCLKIANEMKGKQMKDRFAEWASTIQPRPPL